MRAKIHKSIDELDTHTSGMRSAATSSPFLRHEFLAALEHTGCVAGSSGWDPCYFTLSDGQGLAAAVPAFRKSHSYGEFVFDFAWAQAYARFGSRYYPKLTVAVPFTPATGPRLLIRADLDPAATARQLLAEIEGYAGEPFASPRFTRCFSMSLPAQACEQAGWLLRRDCQFHWTQSRLRDLRRLSRDLHGREAQESAARAAARGRGGHSLRDPHRRGAG